MALASFNDGKKGIDAIALSLKNGHSFQSTLMVPKQKQDTKGAKTRKKARKYTKMPVARGRRDLIVYYKYNVY